MGNCDIILILIKIISGETIMLNNIQTTLKSDFLISFTKGLAELLGKETEVVLHDLKEKKIIYIENGHITGRTIDSPQDTKYIHTIISLADKENHLVGFSGTSKSGRPLRTSHFIFRDDNNIPIALICINQDLTSLISLRNQLNALINTKSPDEINNFESNDNFIHTVTKRVIYNEIERIKPSKISSKDVKLRIIAALDEKGIFDVKDATTFICEELSISQATLYNYLREIRQSK